MAPISLGGPYVAGLMHCTDRSRTGKCGPCMGPWMSADIRCPWVRGMKALMAVAGGLLGLVSAKS